MSGWAQTLCSRGQIVLFSPTLEDAIRSDHPVRLFDEALRELDFRDWERQYVLLEGQPPIHPRVMAGVILYGLSVGIRSSRKLEEATGNRIDFIWLTEGRSIDHSTLAGFRVKHETELKGLFGQIGRLAIGMGMANLNQIALDGTVKRSNNSRYATAGRASLEQKLAGLDEQVEKLLAEAKQVDQCEDDLYGPGGSPSQLPRDLRDIKARQSRLREALQKIETMEQKQSQQQKPPAPQPPPQPPRTKDRDAGADKQEQDGQRELNQGELNQGESNQNKSNESNESGPIQIEGDNNTPAIKKKEGQGVSAPTTDPDSSVIPNKTGGFAPNYTVVLSSEGQNGFIMDAQVVAGNDEPGSVLPAVRNVSERFGERPQQLLADSNFNTGANLAGLNEQGIEALMPARQELTRGGANPALRDDPTQPVSAAHYAKLPISPQQKVLDKSAFVYDQEKDCYHCPMGRTLSFAGTNAYARDRVKGTYRIYQSRAADCAGCPLAGRCLRSGQGNQRPSPTRRVMHDEYETLRREMATRMSSEEGKRKYQRRSFLCETPFAVLNTTMNVRQMLLRGTRKVAIEVSWICSAYNLKKLATLLHQMHNPAPA